MTLQTNRLSLTSRPTGLSLVRLWILLSTLLVGAGWILSVLHQLNWAGYAVAFALVAAVYFCRPKPVRPIPTRPARAGRKLLVRCKKAAPVLFFMLAVMTLASGLLYVPTNADSNGYRIPRVLHWLAEGHWHWIHTLDDRMNVANCGYEWLTAPLLLFTHTDRLLFIYNWVSYLMLPGLIFSVFVRLQVRPRVAWWWMWLLPSGWCFIFQASSTVNDSFAAVYALAAVDFALRARQTRRLEEVWFSLLAAALVTGTKQTAMPLALLWLIAVWPVRRLLATRPVVTAAVGLSALMISAVPTLLLNYRYVGTWSGLPRMLDASSPFFRTQPLTSPFWGVVGNLFCLPAQNLEPPFFPWSGQWNAAMRHFLDTPLGAHFRDFTSFGALRPGISESTAGLGLGLCLLTLVSLLAAGRYRRQATHLAVAEGNGTNRWLRFAPWLLLLLFMAKIGIDQNARLFAPYYIFLFPALLVLPGQTALTRMRWWQRLGLFVMLFAAGLLVVARNRPLLPAETVITRLESKYPNLRFLRKASYLYSNRVSIEKLRDSLPQVLPPQEPVIGYAACVGRSEPWVWLPFGSRRVEHVLPGDSPELLFSEGIHYVVVESSILGREGETIQQWAAKLDGELLAQWTFEKDLNTPPAGLFLVRLNPPPARPDQKRPQPNF
jgi:hypothetical protein